MAAVEIDWNVCYNGGRGSGVGVLFRRVVISFFAGMAGGVRFLFVCHVGLVLLLGRGCCVYTSWMYCVTIIIGRRGRRISLSTDLTRI